MRKRLRRRTDAPLGVLLTVLAVLLYLALLAGPPGLGRAYRPLVGVLALAIFGLAAWRIHARATLLARLRADALALLLGGVVLLAVAIRLLRAPHVVPAAGTDEAFFAQAALQVIRSGEYLPSSLRYPSLLVYLELATSVLRFLAGASANLWTWPTELVPEHLYAWGRALVVLLGAVTLVPVYRLGGCLYGQRAGLLAAFFLALLPMHVATAGTITPEVPAALLTTLAVWFSLRLLEERTVRWALAAGACAGLAAATHYPAGLVALVPLLAACIASRPQNGQDTSRAASPPPSPDQVPMLPGGEAMPRWMQVLSVLIGASLAFVVACPAAVFQTDRLVSGLAEAARAYFPAQGSAGSGLRYLVLEGLGIGPALLALLGLGLVLPRLRRTEAIAYLFPALFYLALLIPRARFPRDLVLLAPWPALLAAAGVDRLCACLGKKLPKRSRLRRWLPWGLELLAAGLFVIALV